MVRDCSLRLFLLIGLRSVPRTMFTMLSSLQSRSESSSSSYDERIEQRNVTTDPRSDRLGPLHIRAFAVLWILTP